MSEVKSVPSTAVLLLGLYTLERQHAYDEMAGTVPLAASILGWIFAVMAGALLWLRRRAGKNRRCR